MKKIICDMCGDEISEDEQYVQWAWCKSHERENHSVQLCEDCHEEILPDITYFKSGGKMKGGQR